MRRAKPSSVGKDVAMALGYSNPLKAIRDHVDNEDKLGERIVHSGQKRNVIFINESGLHSLILSSKLEQARQFKRWVTSEVLPAIRKTGRYEMTPWRLWRTERGTRISSIEAKSAKDTISLSADETNGLILYIIYMWLVNESFAESAELFDAAIAKEGPPATYIL